MDIEIDYNETSAVKSRAEKLLAVNNFEKLDSLVYEQIEASKAKILFPNIPGAENAQFVPLQKKKKKKTITKTEFFRITGVKNGRISPKSGRFQEYLRGHYLEAEKMHDEGYMYDVLIKAEEFKKNLKYVRELMKDKTFAAKWRKEFGNLSAVKRFKDTGNLDIFNFVKDE